MAWGLEARVPFLDKEFLEVAMDVRPEDKTFGKGQAQEVDEDGKARMEKYILRKAFDVKASDGRVPSSLPSIIQREKLTITQPYLPDEILWRQKEQVRWLSPLTPSANPYHPHSSPTASASRGSMD